uniref:Uncharacterized protein n=1 Tax=Tetradesmus obliquus TaxID=3088 RepID=A0A383VYI6_TETOB|eukprot:jgi/Sobl393_1/7023/SZX70525.1
MEPARWQPSWPCAAQPSDIAQAVRQVEEHQAAAQQLLQQLLSQPLPLHRLHVDVKNIGKEEEVVPSLAHLTQLTELSIIHSMTGGAALPAQLQSLYISNCTDLAPVLALQQLQCLTICPNFLEQQQVLELAKLPAL